MASTTTNWILQLIDKISAPIGGVKQAADGAGNSFDATTDKVKKFGSRLSKLSPINLQAIKAGIDTLDRNIKGFVEVGATFDASLRDVSAITGITGKALNGLGNQARDLAKGFGTTASDNLGTFQTVLSRLGPQIGDNAEALGHMGRYANTLAKTMDGDVAGATDALTTSMLQFQVNLRTDLKNRIRRKNKVIL
ncbi:MAG: phage tail tape measure protein [Prevotellaceae bacterium]|jgi:hypothetical protein|nr:phage tail tape measure protein [Prevotellaceae bacterium]